MKYIISAGVILMMVLGYFLFVPSQSDVVSQKDTKPAGQLEQSLDEMVALKRENLPMALSDTVTLNDVVFFPRMRIMEYVYVSTTPDILSLQAFVEGLAETLCREVRAMSGQEVTLRNSFESIDGGMLRRIYLLEEDCQRFY